MFIRLWKQWKRERELLQGWRDGYLTAAEYAEMTARVREYVRLGL